MTETTGSWWQQIPRWSSRPNPLLVPPHGGYVCWRSGSGLLPHISGSAHSLLLGASSQEEGTSIQLFQRLESWSGKTELVESWRHPGLTMGESTPQTIPKTPEQNGAAEWLNCTLVETTRSMLLDAKLPQAFWEEAVSTAAYLRNSSPTSALESMTPLSHLAWYGQKPGVEHLRVFESTAYVHISSDSRTQKPGNAFWLVMGVSGRTLRQSCPV